MPTSQKAKQQKYILHYITYELFSHMNTKNIIELLDLITNQQEKQSKEEYIKDNMEMQSAKFKCGKQWDKPPSLFNKKINRERGERGITDLKRLKIHANQLQYIILFGYRLTQTVKNK